MKDFDELLSALRDNKETSLKYYNSDKKLGDKEAKQIAEALTKNTVLKSLDLSLNQIGDSGAAEMGKGLASNQSLTSLDLSSNQIGDSGAAEMGKGLASNQSLTSLDLSSNQIGASGAAEMGKGLASNQSLKKLGLSFNQIGDSGAAEIVKGLASNQSLKELDLSFNQIRDSGAAEMGKGLASNQSLTSLDLSRNQIGASGAAEMGKGLASNQSLTSLYLSGNQIGDSGAAEMGKGLASNQSLKKLDLSFNQIRDSGAAEMGKGLASNQSLTSLYLSGNQIGDSGAAEMGKGLASNQSLTSLSLSSNQIGDSGAAEMGKGLASNQALKELYFYENQLGNKGVFVLAATLQSNTTLHMISLHFNSIGSLGYAALQQLQEKSRAAAEQYHPFHSLFSQSSIQSEKKKDVRRESLHIEGLERQRSLFAPSMHESSSSNFPGSFSGRDTTSKKSSDYPKKDKGSLKDSGGGKTTLGSPSEKTSQLTEKKSSSTVNLLEEKTLTTRLETLANHYYTYILYKLNALSLGTLLLKEEDKTNSLELITDQPFATQINKQTLSGLEKERQALYLIADQEETLGLPLRSHPLWKVIAELQEMTSVDMLEEAIDSGDLQTLQACEEKLARSEKPLNWQSLNEHNQTLLHRAAQRGDVSVLAYVSKKAVSSNISKKKTVLNAQDKDGNTALHLAALEGHKDAMDFLVQTGADESLPNQANFIPDDFYQAHQAYQQGERPELQFDNTLAMKNFAFQMHTFDNSSEVYDINKQFHKLPQEDQMSLFQQAKALMEAHSGEDKEELQSLLQSKITALLGERTEKLNELHKERIRSKITALLGERTENLNELHKERIRLRYDHLRYQQGLMQLLKKTQTLICKTLKQIRTATVSTPPKLLSILLLGYQKHFSALYDELNTACDQEAHYKALFSTSNPSLETFWMAIQLGLTAQFITLPTMVEAGHEVDLATNQKIVNEMVGYVGIASSAAAGIFTFGLGTLVISPMAQSFQHYLKKTFDKKNAADFNKRQQQRVNTLMAVNSGTEDEFKRIISKVAYNLTFRYQNAIRQCADTKKGVIRLAECWMHRFEQTVNSAQSQAHLAFIHEQGFTENPTQTVVLTSMFHSAQTSTIETKYSAQEQQHSQHKRDWTDTGIFEYSGVAFPNSNAPRPRTDGIIPPRPGSPNCNSWQKQVLQVTLTMQDDSQLVTQAEKYGYMVFATENEAAQYKSSYEHVHYANASIKHWKAVACYGPPLPSREERPPETMSVVDVRRSAESASREELSEQIRQRDTQIADLKKTNEQQTGRIQGLDKETKELKTENTKLKGAVNKQQQTIQSQAKQLQEHEEKFTQIFSRLNLENSSPQPPSVCEPQKETTTLKHSGSPVFYKNRAEGGSPPLKKARMDAFSLEMTTSCES